MKRQTLYRMFSADGTLLYVGITERQDRRFREHYREKPWWPLVAVIKCEHFATRDEVRAAELTAIQGEGPLFNIGDTTGRKPRRRKREDRPRRTRGSGTVRKLPSGKWQARLRVNGEYISAPSTFDSEDSATRWLEQQTQTQLPLK